MRFRPKRNKGFETNGFTRSGGKNNHKDILEVEMKHGDMMVPVSFLIPQQVTYGSIADPSPDNQSQGCKWLCSSVDH